MKPMIFQFSSFESTDYVNNKLTEAIKRLGGRCDDSKIYSPRATHLIIEKIESTEKVLCFIAAGKWIITHSYLKHSLLNKKFIDEEDYAIHNRFKLSKLANVSFKWKNNMKESKQNAPFFNWNVGCFLHDDEKSKAVMRIIKAGYGEASIINQNTKKALLNKFSLIIYDKTTKEFARELGMKYKIPYYPFQAIPDYIMQCIISDRPVLPISHYENLEYQSNTSAVIPKIANGPKLKPGLKLADDFDKEFSFESTTYRSLLTCADLSEQTQLNTMNQEVEIQFSVLWQNYAYNEALDMLYSLDSIELPTKNTLVSLFKFFTDDGSLKSIKSFSYDVMTEDIYDTIYNSIYSYLLNLILNHPPVNENTINLYSEVFDSLLPKKKILEESESKNMRGLIDVLYLISVHDYLMLNGNKGTVDKSETLFMILELTSNEFLKKLVELATKDKNLTTHSSCKLIGIISFCNNCLKKNNLSNELRKFGSDGKDQININKLFIKIK